MPKITIRIKLLLLSVALLSIPYVGFRYLRETERYLQSSLEDSLLAVAGALSVSLQHYPTLFQSASQIETDIDPLFVHALNHAVQLDGYTDDWSNYLEWSRAYQQVVEGGSSQAEPLRVKIVLGQYEQNLYALLEVNDASRRYQQDGAFQPHLADTVSFVFADNLGQIQNLFFGTASPGPVTAYKIIENWDFTTTKRPVTNIVGQWQESNTGYTLEIRIPLHMIGDAMGFVVYDVGQPGTPLRSLGTAGTQTQIRPNKLIRTSAQLKRLIERLNLKAGRRAWVLNRHGQVLASGGSLVSETKRGAINIIYTWLLPRADEQFSDDLVLASRLSGEEVTAALAGRNATRWRSSADERAVIVSAAFPVRLGNELIGAVVVEETTNSIQTLQRKAMADLFNWSIITFVVVTLLIFTFATRISIRLLRLRNDAEQAIDQHGRVIGTISESRAGDEIGDVSRSFAAMLERLRQYNAYLESMAGKLSHEMRTPLAVVTSSLENVVHSELNGEAGRYIERAYEGIERLNHLVRRLGESTRLEQAISDAEIVTINIEELLRACFEGYRNAYPQQAFELNLSAGLDTITGSPDLIVEALDKLIENAIDFSTPGEPVTILGSANDAAHMISVTNKGPVLPTTMRDHLFSSMVSIRDGETQKGEHLGLGLYIVRLVMEFHHGTVSAENLPGDSGVRFDLSFPREKSN